MPPWQTGGNMINDVTLQHSTFQDPPMRFEAGTGNIADAVGLGAALRYVEGLGIENIARYEHDLLGYATQGMLGVPGLTMIGTAKEKASVLSFILDGYSTEQVGEALERRGNCRALRAPLRPAHPAALRPEHDRSTLDRLLQHHRGDGPSGFGPSPVGRRLRPRAALSVSVCDLTVHPVVSDSWHWRSCCGGHGLGPAPVVAVGSGRGRLAAHHPAPTPPTGPPCRTALGGSHLRPWGVGHRAAGGVGRIAVLTARPSPPRPPARSGWWTPGRAAR